MKAVAQYRGFELSRRGDIFLMSSVDPNDEPFELQANSPQRLFECIDEYLDPDKQGASRPAWLGDWDEIGCLVIEPPPVRSPEANRLKGLLEIKPAPRRRTSA